ncbi:hypothetical protein ACWDUL_21260 [Nocardia niigatensis]
MANATLKHLQENTAEVLRARVGNVIARSGKTNVDFTVDAAAALAAIEEAMTSIKAEYGPRNSELAELKRAAWKLRQLPTVEPGETLTIGTTTYRVQMNDITATLTGPRGAIHTAVEVVATGLYEVISHGNQKVMKKPGTSEVLRLRRVDDHFEIV